MKKVFVLISALLMSFSCFALTVNDSVTIKNGIAAVEYVPYNGGVFLYAEGVNKKYVPLIDTVDYAASSFIGVAVDKTYYNLRNSGGVKYDYTIEDNVLSIVYNVKNQIQLTVTYKINKKNIIDVKYSVKNLESVKHSVSVKSVFDTVLGEGKDGAYLTAVKNKINSEYIISDFEKHKYLTSTDQKVAIRFLFDSIYQKYAYKTVIAAKPFFDTSVFEGRFVEGRGFNTVLSYNNSCVGCFFKTMKLNPDEEKSFEQKIEVLRNEFAISENEDDDDVYGAAGNGDEGNYFSSEIKSADDVIDESKDSDVSENTKDAEKVLTEEPAVVPVIHAEKTSEINFSKEEALELIKKINSLEDDGSNTNAEEIEQLQKKLNEVLLYLKNK